MSHMPTLVLPVQVDEACSNMRVQLESMPEEMDLLQRQQYRLRVEEAALSKEKDKVGRSVAWGFACLGLHWSGLEASGRSGLTHCHSSTVFGFRAPQKEQVLGSNLRPIRNMPQASCSAGALSDELQ